MTGSMKRGSKANPLAASITNVTATPSPKTSSRLSLPIGVPASTNAPAASEDVSVKEDPPLPPDPVVLAKEFEDRTAKQDPKAQTPMAVSWRGWWSKPDISQPSSGSQTGKTNEDDSKEDARNTPLPGTTPAEEAPEQAKSLQPMATTLPVAGSPIDQNTNSTAVQDNKESNSASQSKSWFWSWSNSQNHQDDLAPVQSPKEVENGKGDATEDQTIQEHSTTNSVPEDTPIPPLAVVEGPPKKESPSKGGSWAFWSREKSKNESSSDTESTHKQIGELAVSGTPSQARPEEAQFNEREEPTKGAQNKKKDKPKKGLGRNKDDAAIRSIASGSGSPSPKLAQIPGKAIETAQIVPATQTQPAASAERKNLLFPEFYSTYKLTQQPTYWQQIYRYFLGSASSSPHLAITSNHPRIKKALAIGVHGYFPAPLIQKVLGQPTGTSIRFANAAAAAIKTWTSEKGYDV
jgi:hypothetical protein